MRRFTLYLLLGSALALAACGDDDGDDGGGGNGDTTGGDGDGDGDTGGGDGDAGDAGPLADASSGGMACARAATVDDAFMAYLEAWNDGDENVRLCALQRAFRPSTTYIDPTANTTGVEELATVISGFMTMFPDGDLPATSAIELRAHDARFSWEVLSDGASVVAGMDYVEIEDGLIQSIRGYWGDPEEEAEGVLADYVAAWNAADAEAALEALDGVVATDVRFTDAGEDRSGPDDLAALIGALQGDAATTVTVTGAQSYGTHARLVLELDDGDGEAVEVRDYLHLDADGMITRIGRFEGAITPL